MNSNFIKMCLLCYFKYKRGMICATEVSSGGDSISDVTAMIRDKKLSYEIEVKISIDDLRQEFKKYKHEVIYKCINNEWNHNFKSIYPCFSNYFYFCVPENILDNAIEIIKEKNIPYYGIMKVNPHTDLIPSSRIEFVTKSKKINGDNDLLYDNLLLRTSSELVSLYRRVYNGKY